MNWPLSLPVSRRRASGVHCAVCQGKFMVMLEKVTYSDDTGRGTFFIYRGVDPVVTYRGGWI